MDSGAETRRFTRIDRKHWISQYLADLRDFVLVNSKLAQRRYRPIERRARLGEFEDPDDWSNAVGRAFKAQEIALRAVWHELASLVEHEIQQAAHPALLAEDARSERPARSLESLLYEEVVEIVERHYDFVISVLPGYTGAHRILAISDAWRHRGGLKRTEGEFDPPKVLPDYYKLDFLETRDIMAEVQNFVSALWERTKQERPW